MMAKQSFESALKQLEQIVKELETGDIPLEKALQRFEEGIRLSRFCSQKLEETEKKVTLLMKNPEGDIIEKPFLDESDSQHSENESL
jgi:exodeoxyribonuclease VII small subunit